MHGRGHPGEPGPTVVGNPALDLAIITNFGLERRLLAIAAMRPWQPLRSLLLASTSMLVGVSGCTPGTPAESDLGNHGDTPDASADGLPTVSMENLVLQSQVEPFRGDQADLPGDRAVEQVQRALEEEGFGAVVDGWFGNETAQSYAAWQSSLGFEGLGANGIPGPASLGALGEQRFQVRHAIQIGSPTTFSGLTVNQRTSDMLVEAESILGYSIVLTQGSYNAGGVGASAGTHDGGGAVDVSVANLSDTQRWETVKAMRTVGFAAWLRTPDQGPWPYHIHAIAVGDTDLSIGARNQIADYYMGLNGLASHAPDNTPSSYQATFTWWEEYRGD